MDFLKRWTYFLRVAYFLPLSMNNLFFFSILHKFWTMMLEYENLSQFINIHEILWFFFRHWLIVVCISLIRSKASRIYKWKIYDIKHFIAFLTSNNIYSYLKPFTSRVRKKIHIHAPIFHNLSIYQYIQNYSYFSIIKSCYKCEFRFYLFFALSFFFFTFSFLSQNASDCEKILCKKEMKCFNSIK